MAASQLLWQRRGCCSDNTRAALRLLCQQRKCGDMAAVARDGSDALWRRGDALLWQRCNRGNTAALVTTQRQRHRCCTTATQLLWRQRNDSSTGTVATTRRQRQRGCCGGNAAAVVTAQRQHCSCCGNDAAAAATTREQRCGCCVNNMMAAMRQLWHLATRCCGNYVTAAMRLLW